MSRVVHYAAHGRGGLAFPCYFAELEVWSADWKKVDAEKKRLYDAGRTRDGLDLRGAVPMPLRHTDLRKVTCPKCWESIAGMLVGRKLTKKETDEK